MPFHSPINMATSFIFKYVLLRKLFMKIKQQIIEKLVSLGLIENGDQIRVLKKDELEPMTEEMENKARKTHHQSKLTVYENIVVEDISVILKRIKSTPSVRKTLQDRVLFGP